MLSVQDPSEARLWTVLQNLRGPTSPLYLKSGNDTEVKRRLDGIEKEREQALKDHLASKKRY